jgi:hypothetical protein
MRTLLTVNLYGSFGAYHGADSAAGAFAAIFECGGEVAGSVDLLGNAHRLLGAEGDAYLAALAEDLIDFNTSFSSHLSSSNRHDLQFYSQIVFDYNFFTFSGVIDPVRGLS